MLYNNLICKFSPPWFFLYFSNIITPSSSPQGWVSLHLFYPWHPVYDVLWYHYTNIWNPWRAFASDIGSSARYSFGIATISTVRKRSSRQVFTQAFCWRCIAIRCHLKWGGRWPTAGWPTTEIKYVAKQMANSIPPSKCKTLSISTNKVPPQRKYVFLWNQTGTGWMYFLSECIIERTSEVVQTRYISFRGTFGTVQNTCLHSHSSSEAWICLCRLRPIPPKGHCFAWEDPEKSGTVFLRQLSFHSQRYWNVSR